MKIQTSRMEKKLSFSQCLRHLWRFLKPNQTKFWIALIAVLACQAIYAIMPSMEGRILSQLQLDWQAMQKHVSGAHIQMDVILGFIGQLCIIYVLKITCQTIGVLCLTDSIQQTMFDIREAVEHKINILPVSYFDKQKTGDLLSRITNDVETVSNALQQTLQRVIGFVCTLVLVTWMMLRISVTMTLIVWAGLPVTVLITTFIVKKSQPIFDDQQNALADLNGTINELYAGSTEIMVYNHQKQAIADFDKVNSRLKEKAFHSSLLSGIISPLSSLVTYLTIAICALYGCFQVLAGHLLLGDLLAFNRYIWNINDNISQISQLSSQVQSAFSGMNRLFTFLDQPVLADKPDQNVLQPAESIDFEHVDFSYTDQPLIEDLNLHVDKGKTIAIVGPTGAGKTTLVNLLMRFYDVNGGRIAINGQDIRDLSYKDLRDRFGMVLQDTWLFEGTIKDNLLYGNEQASNEQLQQAIEEASIQDLIDKQPDGLNTLIHEDASNFSAGEKQLLTIARALLKDPEILILDEATSSVDTRLERKVQKAMDALMKNRTSFVIAHRLSTITNADQILVMEHGSIVEMGSHEELLARNGRYAALYNSQFQDMDA